MVRSAMPFIVVAILCGFALPGCVSSSSSAPPRTPVHLGAGIASPLFTSTRAARQIAQSSRSETPGSADGSFDLLQLLELAEMSPLLAVEAEKVARAGGAVVQGALWPNPVLRLETEMMPLDDLGFGNARNKVSLAQRIETAGKVSARVDLAQALQEEALASYYHERARLQADVSVLFYGLVFIAAKIDHQRRLVELSGERLALAAAMNREGRLSDRTLIAYEVDESREQTQLLSLQAEADEALAELEGLLGVAPGTVLGCRGEGFSGRSWTPLDPQIAAGEILSRSCELVHKDRRLAVAQADLSLQKSRVYPDITVGLGYSRGAELTMDRQNFVGGFLEIPLPLIDRNQGNVSSAEAAVREAGMDLELTAAQQLDEWYGLHRRWARIAASRDHYTQTVLPELAKSLRFAETTAAAGRSSRDESLEAGLELERAAQMRIDLERQLARFQVEMLYLQGRDQLSTRPSTVSPAAGE